MQTTQDCIYLDMLPTQNALRWVTVSYSTVNSEFTVKEISTRNLELNCLSSECLFVFVQMESFPPK